jgi:hypothetical protein
MNSRFFGYAKYFVLTVLVMATLSVAAFAQEVTGSIVGTVRDSAGAVVPGATVTIRDTQKENIVVRTAVSNSDGAFSAPNLSTSVFSVTVEAANFKKSVSSGIKVDIGQRRIVEVTLTAGKIEEVVNIEANPIQVDLASPQNGTVISGEQVRELSINNRNFTQLVTLAPGVSNDLSDQVYQGTVNPEGQANTVQIAVNGARSSQNTFTVDGADITDRGSNLTIQAYPSVDSIGEFRVLRSLYPAESGRSGGGQVNVVTRSGGSKYRGSAFEFIRNDYFNANDFLSNQTAPVGRTATGQAKRRPFRYNNYGFTFGGPVFGWTKANKTFFFFSEELRKDKRYPTLTSTVPTGALKTGVFTAPICVAASGTTCTTTLPAGSPLTSLVAINSVSAQYLQYIYSKLPEPTNPANYQLLAPALNVADFRQEIIKIDHSFSQKFSMYYRFQNDKIPTIDVNSLFSSGSGLPGVSTTSTNSPGRTHTAQATYSITPNMIVEGRYTYGYGAILSKNIGTLALANSPIRPTLAYANTRDRVPSVSGNGFSNLASFGPYDNFSWKQNFTGTMTWIAGSHTMKFGAVYSFYRKNENALAGNNEGLFSGFNTPGAASSVIATGGNTTQQAWANFLMGTNVTFTQASFDYTADLRQKAFEAFAQDEYRWKRNVTLYFGVRYSFFGAPWDKNGRLTNFVPSLWKASDAPQVTGAGNRVVGTGNFCNGVIVNSQNTGVTFPNCTPTASPWGKFVVNAPKNDFAPRIGMAWDPFGDGKTAVRTGYGIYHEQVLNGTALQMIGANPPYQQTCTVSGVSMSNPAAGCSVVAALTVSSLRAIDPNWKTPYMQHWSFDVQRQLTSKTLMTMGYYGSKGTHLIGSFEKNLVQPGRALTTQCAAGAEYYSQTTPTPTLVACQAAGRPFYSSTEETILDQIRPYRGYRSIAAVEPRFNSNYHSLQVTGQHRFTGASQINVSYTWSRNMTDSQNDRSSSPMNTYNTRLDYGRAALDRRHILSMNFIYELPFMKAQKDWYEKAFGGWQMSGIITFNSGLPFTATVSGYDPTGMGIIPPPTTVGRGFVTCNPNEGARRSQQAWFNTGCFVLVPNSGTSGIGTDMPNAGRSIIEGPPTKRVDFTMSKNLILSERFRVQFRAEAFNIFNIVNFRSLSLVVPSVSGAATSTFGRVTAVRDPRVMQFGVKFNF